MKVFVCHSGAPRNPLRILAAHQRGTFTQAGPVDQTNAGSNPQLRRGSTTRCRTARSESKKGGAVVLKSPKQKENGAVARKG
jgi:hypothetical protein